MRILIVSATAHEIAGLGAHMQRRGFVRPLERYAYGGREIDVLVTGVGMVATAAWCARVLAERVYDFALNLGVCGSFDRALAPGTVVHVVRDRLSELGVEDDRAFVTVQELGLLADDAFPFSRGELVNAVPPANVAVGQLPAVCGITVNTAHGNDYSIEAVRQRFRPQIESMEGAAFMYACLIHGVPFAQVRAVSNIVERRNRAAWKLDEAIRRLDEAARAIIDHA